jgi:hypothetical protein
LDYYETPDPQCDIANYAWSRTDCCGNTTFDWSHDCNQSNSICDASTGIVGILSNFGSISSVCGAGTLTKAAFVGQIDVRRPFIMRFGWTGGGGHFLVTYGYDQNGDFMNYMDPWPGNGFTTSVYEWVVDEEGHEWTHTLQLTTDPPNKEPLCDANGPYEQECQGTTTQVSLDGSASSDPDPHDTLTYLWDTMGCPGGSFDDSSSATPTLTMDSTMDSPECTSPCLMSLTVTDNNGLPSQCYSTVSVVDTLDPYFTNSPSNKTIQCDESTDPSHTGTATAGDTCDPVPDVASADTIVPGSCPQEYNIQRNWTATDDCGLTDDYLQNIHVVDTVAPVITCPDDVTIECDESTDPSNTGTATAPDNCDSNPSITHSDAVTPGACPDDYVIARTWTATDACGNSNTCEQIVTIEDTTAPVISCNSPSTITPPDAPIPFEATATDNCDDNPSVEITGYDCYMFTKKGKRIDKTESCVVSIDGDTITIHDSGGVDDIITWDVSSSDCSGNSSSSTCTVNVVNPAK